MISTARNAQSYDAYRIIRYWRVACTKHNSQEVTFEIWLRKVTTVTRRPNQSCVQPTCSSRRRHIAAVELLRAFAPAAYLCWVQMWRRLQNSCKRAILPEISLLEKTFTVTKILSIEKSSKIFTARRYDPLASEIDLVSNQNDAPLVADMVEPQQSFHDDCERWSRLDAVDCDDSVEVHVRRLHNKE